MISPDISCYLKKGLILYLQSAWYPLRAPMKAPPAQQGTKQTQFYPIRALSWFTHHINVTFFLHAKAQHKTSLHISHFFTRPKLIRNPARNQGMERRGRRIRGKRGGGIGGCSERGGEEGGGGEGKNWINRDSKHPSFICGNSKKIVQIFYSL